MMLQILENKGIRFQSIFIMLILAVFLSYSFASAETIDGPANLRDKPKGRIVAILNDKVEIEMFPPYIQDDEWLSIAFVAYVEKNSYAVKETVVKGKCKLFDKRGRIIGQMLDSFKADWSIGEENGRFGVVFDNIYTHSNNVKRNSIAEYELVALLDRKKASLQKDELIIFLDKYEFRNRELDADFEEYYILESGLYDPSPMPRLMLVFYRDKLILVIHRELLQSKKYLSFSMSRGLMRMYIPGIDLIDVDVLQRIQNQVIRPLEMSD